MTRRLSGSPFAMALVLVVAGLLYAGAARADTPADAVALLPLDAEKRLEIYGRPVASEIARVLKAGNIDVVVVGPKMAVPDRARLIVDGTISAGKGETVVLTMRIRTTADGTVLATMQATAPSLASIDTAAADLSARVLPEVRSRLAAIQVVGDPGTRPDAPVVVRPPPVTATTTRPVLVSVEAEAAEAQPLRAPLVEAVGVWAQLHGRVATPAEPTTLTRARIATTVKSSGNDLAIALEILSFVVEQDAIPLARARVRVRISDAVGIVFDRIIVTDTIVGDKQMTTQAIAVRTAREVVDIMRPHVKRTVAGWR